MSQCFMTCNIFMSLLASIQICRIENMSHLSELQVLNLAGNSISRVENLRGLDGLTELNLRHNCVSAVVRGAPFVPVSGSLKAFYFLHAHYSTASCSGKYTKRCSLCCPFPFVGLLFFLFLLKVQIGVRNSVF